LTESSFIPPLHLAAELVYAFGIVGAQHPGESHHGPFGIKIFLQARAQEYRKRGPEQRRAQVIQLRKPERIRGIQELPVRRELECLGQQRRGARVSFARADGNRLPLSSFEEAVGERTALVSTTHVCYKNGFKNNVSALAELAHERGAYLLIDAYQSMGTQPMDVKALDLDFLVTGALKYLLGTPGVAFMYVRRELIERFEPADSGWFGQENVFAYDVHHLRYAGEARRFETGSPPVPNVYAALAALRLLAGVGLATIEQHVSELMGRFIEGARQRGLVLLTPEAPADRGPLAMVRSTDAPKLVVALARDGILCSTRDGALRVSLHYYNTAEDVDAVLSGLDRHPELLVTNSD